VIGELGSNEIAGGEERAQPHVARITAEAQIVAQHAARLPRLVVASETRSGRDSDQSVEVYAFFHHHVDHAGCKEPAHRSAFKHKSFFHFQ